jgi:hypothetical protein
MLPLDLPGIDVTDTQADDRLFAIHAGCSGRPAACVVCASANFIGHGQYDQEVMDLPFHVCLELVCINGCVCGKDSNETSGFYFENSADVSAEEVPA